MSTKYEIHAGYPQQPLQAAVNAGSSTRWGWSRTLDRAIARAEKLTRDIRTDVPVGVVVNGEVVAVCGTTTGPGGVFMRPLKEIRATAPNRCLRCGDRRASPDAWWGIGDIHPDGYPVMGGVGPCGDMHVWPTP